MTKLVPSSSGSSASSGLQTLRNLQASGLGPQELLEHGRKLLRAKLLRDELAEREAERLARAWETHARPEQLIPRDDIIEGGWHYWLIRSGRGWGKTRVGAETSRIWVKTNEYVNFIGATADDARDIMIEGESGVLAVCPKDERPRYLAHKRRLEWPNGAKSLIFTADEPERFRGKQHMKLWCDEVCSWRYPEAWDQAKFGLRLGANPQAVLTTTPKPTKLLKEIMSDPHTYTTTGHTRDNEANLAKAFLAAIVAKYEGTRLGRQELAGEVLGDNPGALWRRHHIEDTRRKLGEHPSFRRVVVAIDPSATKNKDSDETGIVAAAMGSDGRGYVLRDASGLYTPDEWGKAAVALYHELKADRIVAEVNNGGDMVEHVVRAVDKNASYKAVHASRGKITRAEPVSALYEQGRVSHVGAFPALEDQMCDYDAKTTDYSPDRMDALVWALTDLMVDNQVGESVIEYYEKMAAERAALEAKGRR